MEMPPASQSLPLPTTASHSPAIFARLEHVRGSYLLLSTTSFPVRIVIAACFPEVFASTAAA